ncbi:MAG: LysM peptidoglycan-binding domain-containing protein [Clostridiales bacterium]|nr:LysM peptidoglycan-binding domain-containing protein [Clostridiales bacterium]
MIYTVKSGDTLFKIANQYGVTINDIVVANGLSEPDSLSIGQNLFIPNIRENSYTVKAGDTLYKIAMRFGIPLEKLISSNPQISNPNIIQIGEIINIPDTRKTIEVNGYAIANIDNNTLNKTLPNLTYLSIFSYQVNANGELSNLYESELINKAVTNFVAPIMVVTNISSEGGFDSDIAHKILTDQQTQEKLLNDIISIVVDKNYYGINIDFEYIYPEDRDAYNQFLRNLKSKMNSINTSLTLLVAVAPKYRDNQQGILYEAHNYKAIGEIADRVIIMTYEWGYMYGEPMAVSPKKEMASVLRYAVTKIPSQKILMGLPNYAYDWTLPFKNGDSARAISNNTALSLALSTGASIRYDSASDTPYFEYIDTSGKPHIVWFDDAKSIDAKLKLVTEFNLAGISIWTVNNFFAPLWSTLNDEFIVRKLL